MCHCVLAAPRPVLTCTSPALRTAVQGIADKWSEVGTPDGARLAAEYMRAPAPAGISSAAAVAMTGACFGLLAFRRPKLAVGVAGRSAFRWILV